ncbi:replication-associated recombination protein A [Clostridium cochlearium]|uniref:replication-associated recombination protein A n=1 Tax=Clostridium cochlearium TaxID=1494 RepID=UPI000B948A5C|nr:replication-associated recombination protein A [Clostridium cochlearium]NMA58125.1 replication-associated recombination protein A [Clostridium cochlearium]NME96151.1 replication-associated recombination protein A [Clostridium cochlearium]SNV73669.1 recombination factor protein RarA [Clostridium cochlearium]STA92216.1 recombination factor protein RarA [Clostridium cochlearium]
MIEKPLADKIRPKTLDEVFGQKHILGQEKILRRIISSEKLTNMIFYGPPGTGKTTVANIIANKTNKTLYKLNATNASLSDIKSIIGDLDSFMGMRGVVLYLDEIQNFNKKQQQSLLEFMEKGQITLIASTTENPYHYIYKAILSRATIFEFKPLLKEDILKGLKRALDILKKEDFKNTYIDFSKEALEYIANVSNGDLRRALNALELCAYSTKPTKENKIIVDLQVAMECTQRKVLNYDKFGDSHYDIISAFQKSIRGSDPDASIHYLARLIEAGDLISICRRLLVIASEDIGLAYPSAISIVKSCVDSAMQLGLPEGRIPLAQATILLATSPKSNSCIEAIDKALMDIRNKDVGDIPSHIRDSHYSGAESLNRGRGYKYPHNYSNNYVKQQYLPENIKDVVYYKPGKNKMEEKILNYIRYINKEY